MKRWTGGSVILALAALLALRYSLLPNSTPSPSPPPPLSSSSSSSSSSHQRLLPKPKLKPEHDPSLFALLRPPFPSAIPHLAWSRLLSRSDALPNTRAALLEASAAWSHLQDQVFNTTTAAATAATCPFALTGNASFSLLIPCGLVDNSAVTLLGVPAGYNATARFAIELLGSQPALKFSALPVVLRINVSLGGADGEAPALAQSSWVPELGWGPWELCPDDINGNPERLVDGLVRCNERSGEHMVQEKQNTSTVASKRSGHESIGFPFVEGQPFTATLWAGLEGFHLTVNGRHETSFAYRERLEPWSVSLVQVDGDLDLLSILANGLPVSEYFGSIEDVDKLKAPPLPKKRILLLIGVFSTGNNFERRMALRRTWMQYEAIRSGVVAVRFFIGLHKNKQVNLELWEEARTFGDIQMMPFVDYYSLITLKTVAICIYGTKILPAKYIMKTDDDAFVRIDEVLSILKKSTSHGLLYGLISFESSPQRDRENKWYISPKEWPQESYPPWAHGPGYIISRDIAKFIVRGHQEMDLPLFKLEDVAMGIWIQEFKNSGQEVNYVNDERFHSDGCESDYVLAHYQGPRLLLCLWEKLQNEHQPICCE